MGLLDYVRLIRPNQWYKNLVIFIAVFFTGSFFQIGELWLTFLGFISLCLISSANYVINDLMDAGADRKHPEKKDRPIASGKVGRLPAAILAAVLAVASLAIAYTLAYEFLFIVIALFVLTQLYSLLLRNEPFIDIIIIGVNFVLRSISGTYIIASDVSSWLVVCAFFLALFVGFGKRTGDLMLLGSKAQSHKKVYKHYSLPLLETFTTSLMAMLIVSYALYTFLGSKRGAVVTLPVVLYGIYRYKYLISSGSPVARKPECILGDFRLMASIFLWLLMLFVILYVIP
jgi:4-hydroxybenzoate polyprenyltransferase